MKELYTTDINKELLGKRVNMFGWVQVKRQHGGVVFVDLRDREGIVQIVFDEEKNRELFDIANTLKSEYVIEIRGVVRKRENPNPNIPTGDFEIVADELNILNESKTLPIQVIKQTEDSEEIRLKYRYIDLRRERMRNNIIARYKISKEIRNYLDENGFIDIETPFLTKSTPEGARDFLVPSRINRGRFYALPQSPQLFKQLLMISGFERYYQIVKCFRDEDLRADRQPEFTQLDIELSFITEEDIFNLIDNLFARVLESVYGINVRIPFKRMTYGEAIEKYGSDRPDLRYGYEIFNARDWVLKNKPKEFVIDSINKEGNDIYGLVMPLSDKLSRKVLDGFTKGAKDSDLNLFSWLKVSGENISGPMSKIFENTADLRDIPNLDETEKRNYVLFLASGKSDDVKRYLGDVRIKIADIIGLSDKKELKFCWITDFPLFEWSEDEGKVVSVHHPFTSPKGDILDVDSSNLDMLFSLKSRSYDLVLNGVELGGGSIRIHRPKVQKKVFSILGLSDKEIDDKFGFLINALDYGAPPHGGIAFGLDRIVMIFQGEDSIREVIPFPKTASGVCPLTGAPDVVSDKQLREIGIRLED